MTAIAIDVRMIKASGIGTYLRQVLPRIVLIEKEWDFFLLGDPEELDDQKWTGNPNVRVIPFKAPIYSIRQQREMPGLIPKKTDLLWVPHYDVPFFYKGPLMVTIHDAFHLAMPQHTRGMLRRLYAFVMFGQVGRKSKEIIAVSDFTKSELVKHAGMEKEKIHVVPQGVDDAWFLPALAGRPHPRPYLLYVGNVKPHKNLVRLLEAFQRVWKEIPHDLVLVGKKEGFRIGDSEVLKRAQWFGDRVRFTGWVSDMELKRYYSNAETLIFPSLYEGFGLPPLEAMASGCPVITSRIEPLLSIYGDGALYFDPYDPEKMAEKIMEVVRNPGLREDLREKGLRLAGRYSWDECASKTDMVIRKALGVRKTEGKLRLVIANNYLFLKGGAEKVVLDQRDLFRAKGHEVFLFSQKHPANPPDVLEKWFPPANRHDQRRGISVVGKFFRFIYSARNGRMFGRFLDFAKPDLVHVHNLYGGLTTSILGAARKRKIPVVMTLHDYKLISPSPNLLSRSEPCVDCLESPGTFRCVVRRCDRGDLATTLTYYLETKFNSFFKKYKSVAAFIAPSGFLAKKVIEAGYDPDKVHVIPNALDESLGGFSNAPGKYFLYAGRLSEEKGIDWLLKAFSPGMGKLVIAGGGPRLPELREKFKERKEIVFAGHLEGEVLKGYFRGCLAVVVPSLWHENASMTVLEALAHGKPVVASRMGGLPEQVEDGVNGFLVEAGNQAALSAALTRLTSEVGLAETLGKNARMVFEERYSFEKYYGSLTSIYRQIFPKMNGNLGERD